MTPRPATSLWLSLLAGLAVLSSAYGQPLPTGGAFTAGTGAITTIGSTLTITQNSPRAIIDWPSFSIAPHNSVTFNNPGGATLNRVTTPTLSSLAGTLTATGSLYLINQNGVVIAPTGKILTTGSFVAATRDVPDAAFMAAAPLPFAGTSPAGVTNEGEIISRSGSVVLIGATAANRGSVTAPSGTAALAAASRVVLSEAAGPPGLYVAPDSSATGSVSNTGTIRAAAAALTAAGGNVYALAGNGTGLIQATGTAKIGGQVWLTAPAGTTTIAAPIRAIAPGGGTIIAGGRVVALTATASLAAMAMPGRAGGTILAGVTAPNRANEARQTSIATGASLTANYIETSGVTLTLGTAAITPGPGGAWLLDPQNLTIDAAAAATIDAALNTGGDVIQQTTAGPGTARGDITVAAPLTWSSAATLTLSAFAGIDIAAPITITGNGALALTTANNSGGASPAAALNFTNGAAITYTAGADTNPAALTIDAARYTLIFTPAQLQSIIPTADAALARPLDLTGLPFTPLAEHGFSGIFNGLGNTIANLTITDTTDDNIGLFGVVSLTGMVENLGLVGGATTGGGGLFSNVGALAGINEGVLRNDFATGPVIAAAPHAIGDLAGANTGTIAQSYATGAVTALGPGTGAAGGLAGVTDPGGLLTDVYATGPVTGAPYSQDGGLVGRNFETTIRDAFATGAVTGGTTGGLVANDQAGSYLDSYYNTTTTGAPTGPGMGLTTANWFFEGPLAPNSPNTFINAAAWRQGGPYPVLSSLPYVTIAESAAQTYGGPYSAAILGITGPAGQNVADKVNLQNFVYLAGADTTTGIGTYALGGTGARDPGVQIDYTGTLAILPAPLTITARNQATTYGQSPSLGLQNIAATGLLNNDKISFIAFSTDTTAATGIGAYTITPAAAQGPGLSNYIITYAPGTLTIDPARLVVTANNIIATYGQSASLAGQFTVTGLVNGDTVSNLTLSTAASSTAPAGSSFAITPGAAAGSNLANYTITYAPGTLTIARAPLTIIADPQSKQAAAALDLGDTAFTAIGLVKGDSVTAVTLTSPGAAPAARFGVPYAIIPMAATGKNLSNYTITYIQGTLTVTPLTAAPPSAAALPDGNVFPTTLLLATGPASNNPAALPQFISAADAAGLSPSASGLLLSTGLPLAAQTNTLSLLTARARHLRLRLRLPSGMAHAAIGAF